VFHSPAALAGSVAGGDADFNPAAPVAVTADVALANDATGTTADGCEPLVGFPSGRIALLDRSGCTDTPRVKHAQDAGASGAIVVNPLGPGAFRMSGVDPAIHIPAIMVGNVDGDRIKAQLAAGVNATLSLAVANDGSLRWLEGEDNTETGGPARDLWNPMCFQDPGRISDRSFYACSDADSGGVHTNSGVPNHAFALLVDGGAFNGQTVSALGTTRVANLYWRAMSVYEVPDTDFADHADALEQACADLKGVNLPDPATGLPSGLTFSNANCNEVADALLAVELRSAPAFCNFQPLLSPATPALACGAPAFLDDLETDPSLSWTWAHSGGVLSCTPQQWEWAAQPPAGGSGNALLASDAFLADDCPVMPGLAYALFADTPSFLLRAASPVLTFDHFVATEARRDGGNVMASVNGGPFGVLPSAAFRFNPYNVTLETAAAGNTNPLAGQPAFSGTNGGENQGSWGQSQVDLGTLAGPGDTVRLRFQFGADSTHGLIGWYVDNVRVCGDCAGAAGVDGDADGFRSCDGDCDDGVAATHPGAGETNDGLDNQCPGEEGRGLVDEIGPTAGFFDGADPALFSWGAQNGAGQYEVARAATAGFSTDCTTFLTPTASLVDAPGPASRATWFYLVRASAPSVGTFGVRSSGVPRTVPCAP
jgi:thermolysin metallopeptidase-like protein/PA domain-containing protein